jgi:hypothetical protein
MAEVRLGIGISGAAIKLKIKFNDGKLTLGAKIGAGAGLEGKVILTDEAQDVGIRGAVLLEGSTEVKLGEAAIGLDAVISADTNGETENRASATINVPGTDLGVEITVDKGVIETGVSESVEYGISAMIFAGVEYESTVEF